MAKQVPSVVLLGNYFSVPVKNHKHMKTMVDINVNFSSPGLWAIYNDDFSGPFTSTNNFQILIARKDESLFLF